MLQWPEEIEPFLAWLAAQTPQNILEIGTGPGGLTQRLCAIVAHRVISIDLPADPFYRPQREISEARNLVLSEHAAFFGLLADSHAQETFMEVQTMLRGDALDLIFIDGDHSLAGVTQDFNLYRSLLKPGGWVAFHDINADAFDSHGVHVPKFWRALPETMTKRVWTVNGDWGGIGAVQP
jgi:predicted O-methyltransferase YrrM